ncbi:MAG: hypothetical protein FWE65_04030 [Eggerthellaceae bacterium]|nr:hypothetical protein [Eggerthellaceae bacterium]
MVKEDVLVEDDEIEEFDEEEFEDEEDDEDEDTRETIITKKEVAQGTSDLNAVFKEGVAVAREFKGAYDDIKAAFNFDDLFR